MLFATKIKYDILYSIASSKSEMMEDILRFNDNQLLGKLRELGENTGPITSTTRKFFQKRLFKRLHPDEEAPEISSLTRQPVRQPTPSIDSATPAAAAAVESIGPGLSSLAVQTNQQNGNTSPASPARSRAALSDGSESEHEAITVFYGVMIPLETRNYLADDVKCVFTEKQDSLKCMKKYTGSRFKTFKTEAEAIAFSKSDPSKMVPPSPRKPESPTQMNPPPHPPPVSEGSAYRGPKTQDLSKLRKMIEVGDLTLVKTLVWSNPRYLISSGDTPTILQEGCRYNALHSAALKNQPEAAKFVLDTIEDPVFIHLLYPDDTVESRWNRINFLSDLYINTPDKGFCETPLHFACKYGHADVVDILAAHPRVDKSRINKYGATPKALINTRAKNPDAALKEKITVMLDDRFYVPLLRAEDHSSPARVAKPWSPTVDPSGSRGDLLDKSLNAGVGCQSPTDSPLAVKAYAGPMSPSQASHFRKKWLTPPSPSPADRRRLAEIRRGDSDKGLERIGRSVAQEMKVSWTEYWDFLKSFVDLTSNPGLQRLEDHLKEQQVEVDQLNAMQDDMRLLQQRLSSLQLTEGPETDQESGPLLSAGSSPRLRGLLGNTTLKLFITPDMKQEPNVEGNIDKELTRGRMNLGEAFDLCEGGSGGSIMVKSNEESNQNSVACDVVEYNNKNNVAVNDEDQLCSSMQDLAGLGGSLIGKINLQSITEDVPVPDFSKLAEPINHGDNPSHDIKCPNSDSGNVTEHSSALFTSSVRSGITTIGPTWHRTNSEESRSSVDSFYTALDDLDLEYIETFGSMSEEEDAEDEKEVSSPVLNAYLYGTSPTKEDVDVLRALDSTPNLDRFPAIARWKGVVLSQSEESRARWSSPARTKVPQSVSRQYTSQVVNSPALSELSFSSVSDSDVSTDSEEGNVRANLMANFLSAK